MELKIASRQRQDSTGALHTFHYYLTSDYISSGSFCCENYGVRISEDSGETAVFPSITVSALRMDELMSLLVENRIGPSALSDVVVDWL